MTLATAQTASAAMLTAATAPISFHSVVQISLGAIRSNLSNRAFRLWALVCAIEKEEGFWVPQARIARELNVSVSTIGRSLKELVLKNYLVKQQALGAVIRPGELARYELRNRAAMHPPLEKAAMHPPLKKGELGAAFPKGDLTPVKQINAQTESPAATGTVTPAEAAADDDMMFSPRLLEKLLAIRDSQESNAFRTAAIIKTVVAHLPDDWHALLNAHNGWATTVITR